MRKCLLVLIFCLLWVDAWAATHYASPSGSASWANSTNIETPCSVATAFDNAEAGDLVLFRGGTYTIPKNDRTGTDQKGTYMPAHAGTGDSDAQRVILQAYPGETPVINGTSGGTGDSDACTGIPYATPFGFFDNNDSYWTLDGFSFQADDGDCVVTVVVGGADYITIKNCTFNGGSTVYTCTDNREAIYSPNYGKASYLKIQNCTFYNYRETNNYTNTSCIKLYLTEYATIENCEMYDCATGIYLKSANDYPTIRYNYIHDVARAIAILTNSYYQTNGEAYHNIISKPSVCAFQIWGESDDVSNWDIYNNTFYAPGSTSDDFVTIRSDVSGSGISFRNNIIQSGAAGGYGGKPRLHSNAAGRLVMSYMDYNCYGSNMNVRIAISSSTLCADAPYTSITDLRNVDGCIGLDGGEHNQNSLGGNAVVFANASGTMKEIVDFALDDESPGYQAGSDGKDMGADISLVGTGGEAPADTTPDQFTFTDVTDADLSTVCTSNQITISGIDAAANVSITGGTYSKNGGGYTSDAGTCENGDTFTVRVTSSDSYSTAVNATLAVGGVSDTYTVTTKAEPDPDPPSSTSRFRGNGLRGNGWH